MPDADLDWVVRRPHPALRALVERYIGYRQHGVTLDVHRGLPSRNVTLIISLADPVRMLDSPSLGLGARRSQAFVGGLHTGPALIAQDFEQAGVHVEISPLGVQTLLGVSAPDLAGQILDVADLPRPGLAELPERLFEASGWASRFELLDQALLTAATSSTTRRDPPGEVNWAWRRLVSTGGTVSIGSLAEDVGWSRRHFSQRFARELGLSPKQTARVVRFGRAAALVRTSPIGGLAEVAYRCGYFDQAHLTNEWRALAGCTPSVWIAEELPFLQDDGAFAEPS